MLGKFASIGKTRYGQDFRIHYQIHGDGPVKVVFIMGLNVSLQSWEEQYTYFGNRPEFSALVFDNRGVGWSDLAPTTRYTTSDMAKDVYELLMWIGWREPVHIVGVSMGGMIALEFAILAPELTSSLSLTSTTAGRTLTPIKGLVQVPKFTLIRDPIKKLDGLRDLIFPQEWLDVSSTEVEGKTNREVITEKILDRFSRSRIQHPAGALAQLFAVLTHHVSQPRLKKIVDAQIPVLVCTGTQDHLVHPRNSDYLAKMLKARVYKVFHGAGHAVLDECYEEYNALLHNFFLTADRGRSRL